jgi:hypothetical protein
MGGDRFENFLPYTFDGKMYLGKNSTTEDIMLHDTFNVFSQINPYEKNVKIKIYRNIILPVVLYGCETSLLTLREECRLRIFENKVLRRIFGPKRDEVTGEWRRFHNKGPYALYSSNIIRVIKSRRLRLAGHVARIEAREMHTIL